MRKYSNTRAPRTRSHGVDDGPDDAVAALRRVARPLHACCTPAALQPTCRQRRPALTDWTVTPRSAAHHHLRQHHLEVEFTSHHITGSHPYRYITLAAVSDNFFLFLGGLAGLFKSKL